MDNITIQKERVVAFENIVKKYSLMIKGFAETKLMTPGQVFGLLNGNAPTPISLYMRLQLPANRMQEATMWLRQLAACHSTGRLELSSCLVLNLWLVWALQ